MAVGFSGHPIYVDRETQQRRCHHLHETVLQRAVREAVRMSGISKRATCHTFRHCQDQGFSKNMVWQKKSLR